MINQCCNELNFNNNLCSKYLVCDLLAKWTVFSENGSHEFKGK